MSDLLLRAEAVETDLRVTLLRGTELCSKLCTLRAFSGAVAQLFSEGICAGLITSPLLQEGERASLRWSYEGSLPTLLVDVADGSRVRATFEGDPPLMGNNEALFGRAGKLGIARSNPHRTLNTGTTLADRLNLSLDLATGLTLSDQIPTCLICRCVEGDWLGLMLQGLPGSSFAVMEDLEAGYMENFPIQRDLEASLENLGIGSTITIHDRQVPTDFCTCDRGRIEKVLSSLGREELEDMIQKDGGAQVDCQFCGQTHRFEALDLRKIIEFR